MYFKVPLLPTVEFFRAMCYDNRELKRKYICVMADVSNMKKRDWIAAAVILAVALFFGIAGRLTAKSAQSLRISVDGETYGIYSLDENREVAIGDTNVCRIQDGKVRMIQADCPDQICVHTAEISVDGGSIVCLPNRIVLEIISDQADDSGNEVDSVSS